jgi:hypothetical protein
MSSSHFSIVQFPGSERTNEVEVEIVPTSWINLETKSVLWPPSTVTGAALKNCRRQLRIHVHLGRNFLTQKC